MSLQTDYELVQQLSSPNADQMRVGIATTNDEKEAIYKFRYQVYIEEMGKPLESADHVNGLIHDSTDDRSVLIYVQINSTIIGTSRLTIAKAANFPHSLQKIFSMDKFQNLYPQTDLSLATKLAIKAEYRGSQVLYLISSKAYEVWREHNVHYTFGGCNPYLIPLYEQLGFQRFTANFTDPGYGMLVPLVLVIEDINHFRAVRSPFYRIARRWTNDPMPAIKFFDAFPSVQSFVNTQLITKEALWNSVTLLLGRSPLKGLPLLRGLSEDAAAALLHLSAVFPCTTGDQIYGCEEKSSEIYVLLAGALLSEKPEKVRIIRPGDAFGNLASPISQPVNETVTTLTDANILVISWQALERFAQKHPDAAIQVRQNLEALTRTAPASLAPDRILKGGAL